MKITREIHQVGGESLSASEDAAIYLIHFGDHAAAVDAGCGHSMKKVLANVKGCGVLPEQIEYLLLTHCHFDHTGGAKALKEYTGCRIVAHALDAEFLEKGDNQVTAADWYDSSIEPFSVDLKLAGPRQEILLGGRPIEAIHAPGHSPGSVVYLTESDGLKILFAQDVHGPLHPSLLSKREDYLHSLEVLLALQADVLCEGHYGVYRGKKEVARFIKGFM